MRDQICDITYCALAAKMWFRLTKCQWCISSPSQAISSLLDEICLISSFQFSGFQIIIHTNFTHVAAQAE